MPSQHRKPIPPLLKPTPLGSPYRYLVCYRPNLCCVLGPAFVVALHASFASPQPDMNKRL